MKNRLNSHGFTLIEIMVSIFILSGLSILTAEAIRNGLNSREKYNRQIRDSAQVRDALRVMERDVQLAFHHRDIFTTMLNDIKKKQAGGSAPPPPPGFNDPNQEVPGQKPIPKNLTSFIGDAESVHFTSLSNVRLYKDAPESEQMEVGYFTRQCRSRKPKRGNQEAGSSLCLVRRTYANIDEDVTQGGTEVVLVENVQEFKLRYFGPQREDWIEVWKTGKNGDAISKENFPYAVEISLAVHDKDDPKSKPVSMVVVAPIRFPNNPPKKKENEVPGGGP